MGSGAVFTVGSRPRSGLSGPAGGPQVAALLSELTQENEAPGSVRPGHLSGPIMKFEKVSVE